MHPRLIRLRARPARRPLLLAASAAVALGMNATLAAPEGTARGEALLAGARHALADGVPEVAAEKLRELLRANLDPGDVRAATALLARARLQAGDPAGALAAVDGLPALRGEPDVAGDPEVSFWRAQALAALGRWEEALIHYNKAAIEGGAGDSASAGRVAAARLGRAEALLALGRNDEAKRALVEGERASVEGTLRATARLRLIALALEAGALDEAATRLAAATAEPIAGETRVQAAERRLFAARLALARRDFAGAEATLETLRQERASFDERLFAAVVFALADVRAARGAAAGARAELVSWIDGYPRSPFLATAFARLAALSAPASAAPGENEVTADLARWERDAATPDRQARATLALAGLRRERGQLDAAETLLQRFEATFPNHPLRARARLERAAVQLAAGRPDEAQASIAAARSILPRDGSDAARKQNNDYPTPAELALLDARASLALGNLPAAARTLVTLSERDPALAEPAALAAALILLRAGEEESYAAARDAFVRRFPTSPRRSELPLEEGLIRAAHAIEDAPAKEKSGESTEPPRRQGMLNAAADSLRQFLRESPTSPRSLEARLALAELALLGNNGRDAAAGEAASRVEALGEARRQLAAIAAEVSPDSSEDKDGSAQSRTSEDSAATAERADFLAIWLADAPGPARDEAGAIAAAKKFLARWPQSSRLAEARLKLGEIYFRREDYADAQTQLELIGRDSGGAVPTPPALFEHARYLAGLAALRSLSAAGADRAVALFEDAARVNGTMKTAARLRQAETLRDRLGKPADALRIYDSLLAPPPPAAAPEATPKGAGDRGNNQPPVDIAGGAGLGGPAKPSATGTPAAPSAIAVAPAAADTLENRCAALCGKGETLLALGRASDAAATFAELAALPGVSAAWRRQALARRGEALEKTGDNAAALAAYYDALSALSEGGDKGGPVAAAAPSPPSDFTWFYRAGFAAARLLKNESRWASAAAIYAKLAAANGPLQTEVEAQLNQLRLEHFLWPE